MRLVRLWNQFDQEIFVDLDRNPEPKRKSLFTTWMDSRVPCGKSSLALFGAITAISILTMILKHL